MEIYSVQMKVRHPSQIETMPHTWEHFSFHSTKEKAQEQVDQLLQDIIQFKLYPQTYRIELWDICAALNFIFDRTVGF